MDKIFTGDALNVLASLPSQSVQTCVTSPPYFGLRDYGVKGQLGLEDSPHAYVANMVELFAQVRRVLRDDGTLWLNLGDSYASGGKGSLKPKDLIGIPWRVALALQADGWYLRQDIIWHKPNVMPESVTDRFTKAHEYIFLLTKSKTYHFEQQYEPYAPGSDVRYRQALRAGKNYATKEPYKKNTPYSSNKRSLVMAGGINEQGRNKRSIWTVPTKPYKGAHCATFPTDLVEPCILAGASKNAVVLDPFLGSGTTAAVARKLGRRYIGIELNPAYVKLAKKRLVSE